MPGGTVRLVRQKVIALVQGRVLGTRSFYVRIATRFGENANRGDVEVGRVALNHAR